MKYTATSHCDDVETVIRVFTHQIAWALTPKFDRSTWPFLKIDKRHAAYRHEKKYYRHDMGHFLNSTLSYFKIDMKNNDRGHYHFIKSTGAIGDPPSRAPIAIITGRHIHLSARDIRKDIPSDD